MPFKKKVLYACLGIITLIIIVAASLLIAAILLSSKLPDVNETIFETAVSPLSIYTQDGVLIGQFGPRKQDVVPFYQIPSMVKHAVLSAEDDRFYEHGAVDWLGVLRAILGNLTGKHLQGASTITMQISRDLFLSNERTYKRKLIETLIAYKLESHFSKDEILAYYINHVYLGKNAFGFSAASHTFFGKKLSQLSIAEAAMLAGLPKAPSNYNPVKSMEKAKNRQHYVLQRMHILGYISDEQYRTALNEPITLWKPEPQIVEADYVSEMIRQYILNRYGVAAYSQGLNVITTINSQSQKYATSSLRNGLLDYVKRNNLAGAITHVTIDKESLQHTAALNHILDQYPEIAPLRVGIILSMSNSYAVVYIYNHILHLSKTSFLSLFSKLTPGDVIYLRPSALHHWEISNLPPVQSALVSADPQTGAIRALCGGFSYRLNQFNHATQAWRQPGSSIKPFIYIAALERGYTPSSVLDDSPFIIDPKLTGNKIWEPKNFDNVFHGPTTLRIGLAKSLNVLSVRLLKSIGIPAAQSMLAKFGFDLSRQPPFLTLVLGAGESTPWQMLSSYVAIANGGYPTELYLIDHIVDKNHHTVEQHQVHRQTTPVMTAETAIEIDDMLKSVINEGTGRAALILNRQDLAGKTGTTNDDIDTWFCGYHPNLATVVWVGHDIPKSLGKHETGAVSALPIWIHYMGNMLKDVPYTPYPITIRHPETIAVKPSTQENSTRESTPEDDSSNTRTLDPFSLL